MLDFIFLDFHWTQLLQPQWYIENGGLWFVLFVVFAETGLFAGFFLPGDSLLFVTGIFSNELVKSATGVDTGSSFINLLILGVLISVAGIIGNTVGYWFGRKIGPTMFHWRDRWLFKKKYLIEAKEFYEKHGGGAIIIARFLPIIRTFAPIVAGIVQMDKKKFGFFNIVGCVAWVFVMLFAGHYLQRLFETQFHFDLKKHLEVIVIGIVLVTTAPILFKLFFGKKKNLTMEPQNNNRSLLNIAIIVAALGYFVDIYDLLLFGIIRLKSLLSLGLSPEQAKISGEDIISWQMIGLMIGGMIWGIMGDKKGRLSVLFGSIILYSLANIANGFVQTVPQYAVIRFIAGIGLAGELGAGITLVSELTPKEKRGIATSLVAGIGLTGAVFAFAMKELFDNWRICYFIGGGLGLFLLILRIRVAESGMYNQVKQSDVQKGNFFMLFSNWSRFKRYAKSILIGLPTWYVIGILITFSNDFAKEFGIKEKIDPGKAIMYAYAAISVGDILVGFVSHWLKSRKKALYIFYVITAVFILLFFTALYNSSAAAMYIVCAGMGFGTGFWAIFVTIGAEQFGTNLRATAATTVPNFVRGMLGIFILPLFKLIRGYTDYVTGGWITGLIILTIGTVAVLLIKETFHDDLDFVEM